MIGLESPMSQTLLCLIFLGATVHALFAHKFLIRAQELEAQGAKRSFQYAACELNGHLTFIFSLWLAPLFGVLWLSGGMNHVATVFSGADLREPFANFTFIFLALSKTLRRFFSALVSKIAQPFGGSATVWWIICLILGVLLDGVFSEAATMVLVCSAMIDRFLRHGASPRFCYVTLAITLMVLGLGNLVLPYNITASMDLSAKWGWDHMMILQLLSWRVFTVILLLVIGGALFLRQEIEFMAPAPYEGKDMVLDFKLLGYLAAIVFAGYFETIPFLLIAVVALICVLERGREDYSHNERLNLPLLIALFNYSMELHTHFQAQNVKLAYETVGSYGLTTLTTILSGLNEHIPGTAFIETFQTGSASIQGFALLALTVGSGLTLFANSINVLASKLLREHFPGKVISGIWLLAYTLPLAGLSFIVLELTYLIVP